MRIKRTLERLPGGMMLAPLLLGALSHTLWPQAGAWFGSFTQGLIGGLVPILAVWCFCLGASIRLRSGGRVLRASGVLVLTKIAVAWLTAVIAARLLPPGGIGAGIWSGMSVLALVAAMDMTNAGLFAALMQQYGRHGEAGAMALMSLESGPLVTMLILGSAGVASVEPRRLLGAVLPLLAGFVLGNLDPALRALFARAVPALIPFFAFALGNTLDLRMVAHAGVAGVALGLLVIVATGIPLLLADRWLAGGNGSAGLAASSTAGAAVATPALVAAVAPQFQANAPAATALVATSVVVTALLVPPLTAAYARRMARTASAPAAED